MYVHMYTCTCICMYACMCTCMYVFMYAYVGTYGYIMIYLIFTEPLILPAISCISDNMLDMTCSWCGTELTTGVGQQANDAIEDTETRWIIYWQKEGYTLIEIYTMIYDVA